MLSLYYISTLDILKSKDPQTLRHDCKKKKKKLSISVLQNGILSFLIHNINMNLILSKSWTGSQYDITNSLDKIYCKNMHYKSLASWYKSPFTLLPSCVAAGWEMIPEGPLVVNTKTQTAEHAV